MVLVQILRGFGQLKSTQDYLDPRRPILNHQNMMHSQMAHKRIFHISIFSYWYSYTFYNRSNTRCSPRNVCSSIFVPCNKSSYPNILVSKVIWLCSRKFTSFCSTFCSSSLICWFKRICIYIWITSSIIFFSF